MTKVRPSFLREGTFREGGLVNWWIGMVSGLQRGAPEDRKGGHCFSAVITDDGYMYTTMIECNKSGSKVRNEGWRTTKYKVQSTEVRRAMMRTLSHLRADARNEHVP